MESRLSGCGGDPAGFPADLEAIVTELRRFPIDEVKARVGELLDDVLETTLRIGQERLDLYDKIEPYVKQADAQAETIATAFQDITESLRLQSELLTIYEELGCGESTSSTLGQYETRLSELQQSVSQLQGDVRSFEPRPRGTWSRAGMFAFWSLSLWVLGILTSLLTIEFLATSEWALEAGLSAAFSQPLIF